jgi:hypothetical protein
MEELCIKNGIFDNKNQKVENHDVVDISPDMSFYPFYTFDLTNH